MICNKKGESIEFDGKKYEIGKTVVAAEESEYEGLFGTITEIRDGKDKETENEGPDIYCSFKAPIFPDDVKKLEETFSRLYGIPKRMDDICLDMVIMTPEEILPIDNRHSDTKKIKLYAVTEDWANNDSYGNDVTLFVTIYDAIKEFKALLASESVDGIIADLKGNSDFIEEFDSLSYDCYIDGFYCEKHYSVSVTEKELLLPVSSLEATSNFADEIAFLKDFIAQISEWDEVSEMPQSRYRKMINDPRISERIKEALSNDDCYQESYWQVVSDVSNDIVGEYIKGGKNHGAEKS